MPVIPVIQIDSDDTKVAALALAVMHHGLSNLAERSIPPKAETVMDTADMFERHLNGQDRVPRPMHSRR